MDERFGVVDPASMIVSPQDKFARESGTKLIGGSGDPHIISAISLNTLNTGTETPSFPTPPTNYSSAMEARVVHGVISELPTYLGTPPTPAWVGPLDAISKLQT